LRTAIEDLLNSAEYGQSFGQDQVPYLKGMNTADGIGNLWARGNMVKAIREAAQAIGASTMV
jgi:hypothetical protein